MGQGQTTLAGMNQEGLGIEVAGIAPGGIVDVADGQETGKALQDLFGKDLGHQTLILIELQFFPIADRDPGTLLAPVLEGIEAHIGEGSGLTVGGINAKYTTGLPGLISYPPQLTLPPISGPG